MKRLVESAERSDTRRDESSRPSSDTLDSFVVPVVCHHCMVVCEDNGYCPECCQYETLDGHNAEAHGRGTPRTAQPLVGHSESEGKS